MLPGCQATARLSGPQQMMWLVGGSSGGIRLLQRLACRCCDATTLAVAAVAFLEACWRWELAVAKDGEGAMMRQFLWGWRQDRCVVCGVGRCVAGSGQCI